MGDQKGFLKFKRTPAAYRPVPERVKDFGQVFELRPPEVSKEQASRCMDCSTSFCHWACPIGNYIPEWNDLVYSGKWKKAFKLLNRSNPLPEITGRVCPALCEYSCVLSINDEAVTIRENELAIIETAFEEKLVKAYIPAKRTGKTVAVIGSGPAGLSAAAFLNRMGHEVTVFEKDDRIGGLMSYGIPDFKLEKRIIERRIRLFKHEGIKFSTSVEVGGDTTVAKMKKEFDAVVIAAGSRVPRDLKIEGRELEGIHFAMYFLTQFNRYVAAKRIPAKEFIDVKGKKVIVIGGGDTGADCVGVANRMGARKVTQIEIMHKPLDCRPDNQPWPRYPNIFRTSSSHEEGCERGWAVTTKKFLGSKGHVTKLLCARADASMKEIKDTDFDISADIVILALGFLHPDTAGLLKGSKIELDQRGNIKTDQNFMTSTKGVFAAGDCRRGQSLIVWAIDEGIRAAEAVDRWLAV